MLGSGSANVLSWFQSGLIFRGKRLVNWDAHLQTAVADDEVENRKQKGTFWYFYYPVAGGPIDGIDKVLIGTTRPETMLGDTAVAVHPDPAGELDKRIAEIQAELTKANEKDQAELRDRLEKIEIRKRDWLPTLLKLTQLAQQGVKLELPMVGRLIPLITDAHADPEKGTGAVKVTPAHDHNDYAVWQRNPHNAVRSTSWKPTVPSTRTAKDRIAEPTIRMLVLIVRLPAKR